MPKMTARMESNQQPQRRAQTGLYVRAARTLKVRDQKISKLVRRMFSLMSWLKPEDIPLMRSWAQHEILADIAYSALRAMGPINADGNAKRLLTDFRQLRQSQTMIANALGMSPMARAQLRAASTNAAFDVMGSADLSESEANAAISAARPNGSAPRDDSGETLAGMRPDGENGSQGDCDGLADDGGGDADGSGRDS